MCHSQNLHHRQRRVTPTPAGRPRGDRVVGEQHSRPVARTGGTTDGPAGAADPDLPARRRGEVAGDVGAEIEKSRAEVIRVQLRTFRGRRYLDVRTYYWGEGAAGEALRPTRKGVSLLADRLPELRQALDASTAAVAGRGARGAVGRAVQQ
jgi:Transcriptional Coactivator p15 (PC4)